MYLNHSTDGDFTTHIDNVNMLIEDILIVIVIHINVSTITRCTFVATCIISIARSIPEV